MFVQNWNTDINNSTRARCYTLYADFRFQPNLNLINIEKVRVALSCFRVSAHRLEVETGRWHKQVAVPFNERKYRTCLNCLEDEFHFLLECPLYHELRRTYIKPYYWKILNMPKFIELIKTENKIEIRNLSMFILKSFEIRKKLYFD